MEKIFIIGANGFLGRKLLKKFEDTYEIYSGDLTIVNIEKKFNPVMIDITNQETTLTIFEKIRPNLTILTAAMTNVDSCEDLPEQAININANGPKNIALAVKKTNGRLIHLSTDFIFDGKKGNYRESDPTNPISKYGDSKLQGELEILKTQIPAIICRTSVLFGWPEEDQHENFFSWAYKQLNNDKKITIIDGQISTPTLVDDLVEFIYNTAEFSESEIYHTTGPESISRYNFVVKIIQIFNLNKNLLKKVDYFPQKAQRPDNSSLNTDKIQKLGKWKFKNISESFQYLKQINN